MTAAKNSVAFDCILATDIALSTYYFDFYLTTQIFHVRLDTKSESLWNWSVLIFVLILHYNHLSEQRKWRDFICCQPTAAAKH